MSSIREQAKKLPDSPGVYLFIKKGLAGKADSKAADKILYVGRATSLRDRVRSYFGADLLQTRNPLVAAMVEEADALDFQKTDSVLEAIILEANLIKKHRPPANTDEKDDKSWNYVVFTRERWPRVLVIRGKELLDMIEAGKAEVSGIGAFGGSAEKVPVAASFGPFPHGTLLRDAMKIIRRIFPYRDARCIPKDEQKDQAGKPCFNRQIGLCPGVCTGEISREEYAEQVRHLKLFFEGKKKALVRAMEKQMLSFAKAKEFEKAAEVRGKLSALAHIHDISLIKSEVKRRPQGLFRIEAYDIAHTAGSSVVGVMTVVEDGEPKKSDYRLFNIRGNFRGSDTDALREVLLRRLGHAEWPLPDLIAMDGGEAQLGVAGGVVQSEAGRQIFMQHPRFSARPEAERLPKLVGVTKDDRHQFSHFVGDIAAADMHKADILIANSEAHRFAIAHHRKKRGKIA